MNPPKWFWVVVASCAVVLTGAVTYAVASPKWQYHDNHVFNPRTAQYCALADKNQIGCMNMVTGVVSQRDVHR